MDDSINFAREKEYVETILGRRRYLRDINSRNITTRGFAERNAINAPIQGSAADIIKIAMVNIHRWLQKEKLKSRMIMQVHDELIFDLHKDEQEIVRPRVQELMKHAVNLEVPMEVESGSWKELARSALRLQYPEFYSSIHSPSFHCIVGFQWLRFTITRRGDAIAIRPALDHDVAYSLCTTETKILIVTVGTF